MNIVINTNYFESAGTRVLYGIEKRLRGNGFQVFLNDWDNYSQYDIAIFMAPDSKIREAKQKNPKLFCILFDPKVSLTWQIKEIQSADLLIVSSIEQKEALLKYNKNIFIYYMFPDTPSIKKEHLNKDQIIIGYHGNKQHLSAMKDVSWALDELAREYSIEFWAIYNIEKLGKWRINIPKLCKIRHIQWSEESVVSELQKCDIGIVPSIISTSGLFSRPLSSFIFNPKGYHSNDYIQRFKFSNNPGRMYVFSQLGIPVITDFTPSACQIIKDRESGMLVGTKEGWLEALRLFTKNTELRKKCALNLEQTINTISPDSMFSEFISILKNNYEQRSR